MRKIPLTQGQSALVDEEDYEYLNQYKWYAEWNPGTKTYYATRDELINESKTRKNRKHIKMHRVIMDAPKGMVVDHINHDTLNNCKSNLRIVTHRQNIQNHSRKTSSRFPGVSWLKSKKKWRAFIYINGKNHFLGYFDEEREAAKAYEQACRELGEELVCKTGGVL